MTREARLAKKKAWRVAHAEYCREYGRRWRARNPDYYRTYVKTYNQANRDKRNARSKEYRKENRAAIKLVRELGISIARARELLK